jgi:hypothetical protein
VLPIGPQPLPREEGQAGRASPQAGIEARRPADPDGISLRRAAAPLSRLLRLLLLTVAFAGLVFDGIELGLMPVASLSVSRSLLGTQFTDTAAGDWFARFTASLMLGAAVGGIVLGGLGDRIGRSRAMGVSILFYSVFAGLGAFVETQEGMLVLRFLVGLGVGGMWPNGVVLVSECWPNASRPVVGSRLPRPLGRRSLARRHGEPRHAEDEGDLHSSHPRSVETPPSLDPARPRQYRKSGEPGPTHGRSESLDKCCSLAQENPTYLQAAGSYWQSPAESPAGSSPQYGYGRGGAWPFRKKNSRR